MANLAPFGLVDRGTSGFRLKVLLTNPLRLSQTSPMRVGIKFALSQLGRQSIAG